MQDCRVQFTEELLTEAWSRAASRLVDHHGPGQKEEADIVVSTKVASTQVSMSQTKFSYTQYITGTDGIRSGGKAPLTL
jgi:hypothetical protein